MTDALTTRGRMADPKDGGQMLDLSRAPPPDFFKLKIQLVDEGSYRHMLADTGNLQIKIRCYAVGGGENAMHAHHGQDHSFIVLMSKARFFGPRGEEREIGRNEGVMLPSGCYYCFENAGDEPLVVLRIESITKEGGNSTVRLGMHGQQIDSHAPENNREKPLRFREGAYYE